MGSDRKLLLLAATLTCGERRATMCRAERDLARHGTAGRVWQHHRTQRCVVRHRRRRRQNLAYRSEDGRGKERCRARYWH